MPTFPYLRSRRAEEESISSSMYYSHDGSEQDTASDILSWNSRSHYPSMTSTQIFDTYHRQRPDYDSVALANPYTDYDPQPTYNTTPSPVVSSRVPIPPLPELMGPFPHPERANVSQDSALRFGLQQRYTPGAHALQTVRRRPVNRQITSAESAGGRRYQPLSRPLDTTTPADKRWEGSWLRRGTLRFDAKAEKKLDRAALKQQEKAEKRRFKEERKQAEKLARIMNK